MTETYVSESQTVPLSAAIGNWRSTTATATGAEARDEERSSGARASSLSWVLVGGGKGGSRAGVWLPMYVAGRGWWSRKARWDGARAWLYVKGAHGDGVIRRRREARLVI
jgi:hypothetical protein